MYRIIITALLAMFCLQTTLEAQVQMRASNENGAPGDTVRVNLFATRARDLVKFSFPISFDPNLHNYIGVENSFDADLMIDETNLSSGELGISWTDDTNVGLNVFRQEFVDLVFIVGNSCRTKDLIEQEGTIVPKETFLVDDMGMQSMAATEYFEGEIRTDCIRGDIFVENVVTDDQPMTEVEVHIGDLENFVSFDIRIEVDTNKLVYMGYSDSLYSPPLMSVSYDNDMNEIIIYYFDNDLTPRDILDTSLLMNLQFRSKMSCGDFTDLTISEESGIFPAVGLDFFPETPIRHDGSVDVSCQAIVSSTVVDVACFGEETGAIVLSVTSGVQPYFYEWSDGPATSKDRTNIPAGFYTVTVTDANQIETILEDIEVKQNPEFIVSVDQNGDCANGTIDVFITANGGVPPYDIDWSTGETTDTITITDAPTTIDVTVTDGAGCEFSMSNISIDGFSRITISADNIRETCKDEDDGALDITVNQGTAPYDFTWIGPNGFNSTDEDISDLEPGMYSVSLTDANNCTAMATFEVLGSDDELTLSVNTNPDSGTGDGRATAIVTGGIQPYTYEWSCTDQTTPVITGIMSGDCCVTVTDGALCEKVECFIIDPSSTDEIDGLMSFNVYPNPVQDVLNVELSFDKPQNLNFVLINNLGQEVRNWDATNQASLVTRALDLTGLTKGHYVLKISNSEAKVLVRSVLKN